MTTPEQTPQPQTPAPDDTTPVIPPQFLLALSGLGFLAGLLVLLFSNEANAIVFGGFGVGVIGLVFWVLMNPDDAKATLTGRNVTFSVTAAVVLLLTVFASGLIYAVVQSQNWSADLSNRQTYSLEASISNVVEQFGADPTIPQIELVAFYGLVTGGERDRVEVLFNEFESASDGKITHRFVDPDRQPQVAERYGAQRNGQVAVVPVDPDSGEPLIDSAELVNFTPQNPSQFQRQITEAVLTATASGDFRAYFATVPGALPIDDNTARGAQIFVQQLRDTYNWTVEEVNLLNLTADNPAVDLYDPAADGIVLVLAGGSEPLNDDVLTVITDFLDAGGQVVLFGGLNLEGGTPLAAANNISSYLDENFGLQMRNNYVFDPPNSSQFGTLVDNFGVHPIVNIIQPQQFLLMDTAHSIDIAETAPQNVETTILASTSEQGYAKSELDFTGDITAEDIQQTPDDLAGELVLAAAAENSETGGRVVLFGSESLLYNQFAQFGADITNLAVARQALFWSTDYENFVGAIASIPQTFNQSDRPLVLTPSEALTINTVSLFVLPFGVLLLGGVVWWMRRERNV